MAFEGDMRRAAHELVHLRKNGVRLSNELSEETTTVDREAKKEHLKLVKLRHKLAHLRTVNAPLKGKEAVVSKHIKQSNTEEAATERKEIKAERKFRNVHGKEVQEVRQLRSRKAKIATTEMEIAGEQNRIGSYKKELQKDKLKEIELKNTVIKVGKKRKSVATRVAHLSAKLLQGRSHVAHLAERLKHARAELRHMLEIEKAQEHRAQTVRAKYLRNKVRARQLSNILRSVKMKNLRALKLARNKVRNGPLQVLVRRLTASRKKRNHLQCWLDEKERTLRDPLPSWM